MAGGADEPLEIEAGELARALAGPAVPIVVDVRTAAECALGMLAGARSIPKDELAARIGEIATDRHAVLVLYCASGLRSLHCVRELRSMGYGGARSLRGGISAWEGAGFPLAAADGPSLSTAERERYSRQLRLPEVGLAGQQRLLQASVLCIGAGGLGSPALLYLAAAGVGRIGIVDDDVVQLSNLQRQVVHATDRVGRAKVDSATAGLRSLNPDVTVEAHRLRLDCDNAPSLFAHYDVIVDGSDNFATRYVVNDAALVAGRPFVSGAVQAFEGQVGVFAAAPCYRCAFPAPPPPGFAPSCDEAGVLGVVPGIVGLLQATETIKLLLGIGEPLLGRLLVVDVLTMQFSTLCIAADPDCGCRHAVTRQRLHEGRERGPQAM